MANYLIIGGHGKVGLRTAPLLAQEGHTVTSVIRDPEQTAEIEAAGAKALVLDIETASQDELARAFEGQDAIVWSAGAGGGNPERTYAVDRDAAIRSMDAALQAGVKRYVMVSYLGATTQHGIAEDSPFFPYAESKAAADEYLRNSGLDWTILGPGTLTLDEPTGMIAVGSSTADGAHRDTSRGNVAQAIRVALATQVSIGQQIEFVDGEEPVTAAFSQL
ncbi:SDR family oxidoreductase [Citricoccus sp.]|uniref:SDR family oxidoreductase n=1 Tax=Citricoccus sp. TaxID=1978372 RepID=UPI0028BE00E3|nr:SDR family oxidoreductase [Citricoccus sp.]